MGRYILWMSFLFLPVWHPLHVCITNVEYDESTEVFNISHRVFSDDFNLLIVHKYGILLNSDVNLQDTINRYFSDSFRFTVNDETELEYTYSGNKVNEEAIWYYYTTQPCPHVRSLTIKNTIMFDLYSDQTNLLIFKCGDFESGFEFTGDKSAVSFRVNSKDRK